MITIKKLIESHKFFVHKSQWYILGQWEEHYTPSRMGSKFSEETLRFFKRNYWKAYIKFMWLEIKGN